MQCRGFPGLLHPVRVVQVSNNRGIKPEKQEVRTASDGMAALAYRPYLPFRAALNAVLVSGSVSVETEIGGESCANVPGPTFYSPL